MKTTIIAIALSSAALLPSAARAADAATLEWGRYLVVVGGCNDCHTPGYGASGGKVSELDWLTGDKLGWKGPWGTTYPANLRRLVSSISEDDWVVIAKRTEMRPPMPWFTLRAMKEQDLRAIYAFIRALGPAGEPAPAYVPPGESPRTPVVSFP